MVTAKKIFFAKWPEKHLENFTHIPKICSKCFSGHFAKKCFLATTNFWTFLMSLAKKNFLRIFIWKNHAKWYQWKKFSGIFLASVCPKEYKNGKIFDRQFFGPRGSISSTVISLVVNPSLMMQKFTWCLLSMRKCLNKSCCCQQDGKDQHMFAHFYRDYEPEE